MQKSINTAIIGFGTSGKYFHAPFLHKHSGFSLKKVVERHSSEAKKIYPYIEHIKDYKILLKDTDIELIVISTPNTLHFEMAKACLKAGKHIIIEKPFTPTTKQADELIKLSAKYKRKIFVYHNRRWDGDFRTVQRIVDKNILGDIYEFEAHFDRYRPKVASEKWKEKPLPAAGIVYDLGVHLIDQALVLFGHPTTLKADIQIQRDNALVDDYFKIELNYPDLKVILTAGMLVKNHHLRYILKGHKGTFKKHGIDPQEAALRKGLMPEGENWGKESKDNWGLMDAVIDRKHCLCNIETLEGNYMFFYDNVYDVLINNAEIKVKPEQARNVIKIVELAFLSSSENNRKIKLIS
jgi:predicted dehydrogenase